MQEPSVLKAESENNDPPAADSVQINNRKYLGSKQRLLPFLKEIILENAGKMHTFIDGFAGTGVVSRYFASYAQKVIANDLLYSNYVVLHTYLNSRAETVSAEKICRLICALNNLQGAQGYVSENFAGSYFTRENAGIIDVMREKIEAWHLAGECTGQEKMVLLTSLIFAIDKVANTVGQYDAFLKHMGSCSRSACGKHIIDINVHSRLVLKMPAFRCFEKNEVYCMDFNELAAHVAGDVLYLDPPYNNRQYIDCYHLLENIVLWGKPPLTGKTRKFNRDHLKSAYSLKKRAPAAFKALIEKAEADHIFLSYNNEGIIPDDFILEVLHRKGTVKVYEQPYSIFGNGAGVSAKRAITERVFYCRVG